MTTVNDSVTPIILDCDPGHDDALAIMLAAASSKIKLLGITTVSGNGGIDRVTENALRVCALSKISNIRVAQGARAPLRGPANAAETIHGESALDGAELPEPTITLDPLPAVELIAELITRSENAVTIVATGPLTNLAMFIQTYPELLPKVERISLMGGSTDRGNWTPLAEFNIWADPEAADIVFKCGREILMAGLNVTHQVLVTKEIFHRLDKLNTDLSRTITPLLKFFANAYETVFSMPDPPLHDPVAVLAVSHPHLLKFIECNVSIELSGTHTRGATVVDVHGVTGQSSNAKVAVGIDVDEFWNEMLGAIRVLGESK